MEITTKTFKELTKEELYELLSLRCQVFVVEQNCAYQDLDNKDQKALHVIGKKADKIVAYTRVFKPGDYFKNPSIGRVLVEESSRKSSLGKDIMLASMDTIKRLFKNSTIELSAQTYLKKFYRDLGFIENGKEYLEDGIVHIHMIKKG